MIRFSHDNTGPKIAGRLGESQGGFEPADRPPAAATPTAGVRPRRRMLRFLLSTTVGLGIAAAIAPTVLKVVVRRQLRALAAENLAGDLRIGSISFSWPWTVSLSDASFVTRAPSGESVEMFRVPRLMLRFAHSPLGKGPVEIADSSIDAPAVHLIQTRNGIVGVRPDATPSAKRRFSDILHLSHLALTGGQFTLDDQTEPDSVPTEWRKIDLAFDKSGSAPAGYSYHVSAEGAASAGIDSSGKVDLDALVLNVEGCTASLATAGATRESPLPAVVQQALRHVGAAGELTVHAQGNVPLQHIEKSTYHGTIEIRKCSLVVAEWQTQFDHVATHFVVDAGADALHPAVHFDSLDASSGDASLHWQNVSSGLDFTAFTWRAQIPAARIFTGNAREGLARSVRDALEQWDVQGKVDLSLDASGPLDSGDLRRYRADLALKPGDYSFRPPDMRTPLDRFAEASINLENGSIHIRQLRAMCADDIVFIREAMLGLADLPERFTISQAAGAVTFGARHGDYPPQVAEYIDRYNPFGPFFFSGNFSSVAAGEGRTAEYDFEVHTPRGRFDLLDRRIPVYNVRSQVHITPGAVTINSFEADTIGGRLNGTGRIDGGKLPAYDLQLDGSGLDLRELAQRMAAPGHTPAAVSGRARLNVHCAGAIPENGSVLDQIKGDGAFDIRQGGFFEVPVVKAIAVAAGAPQAAVVSDAGAKFHVSDRTIHFDRALISAPALGVEGTGDIDFDGRMNFHKVTALTGGDWQRNMGQANPAGQVVGHLQGALNAATRVVWCDLDVTGTVNQPVVKATPAPFLVKPALHVKELLGN